MTPEGRIVQNREAFEKFPLEVQAKVRAGQVDIGFTPEMVRLALGEPAKIFARKTAEGASEVWVYHRTGPRFSFGMGVGGGGGHTRTGAGLAIATDDSADEERMRVEFKAGRVCVVDARKP